MMILKFYALIYQIAFWENTMYDTLYRTLETYCEQFEEPLNICGLSLGGILAMQYAIEHPEKMNSLVLIGTTI